MTHGSLITTVLVNSYMDRPGAGLDNYIVITLSPDTEHALHRLRLGLL